MDDRENKLKGKIEKFVKSISFLWKNEALDGDETEEISKKILAELDLVNGNITKQEYERLK
ncbi:MAG: hypothetical protein V1701_05235 [Planctomycetota bacterium]